MLEELLKELKELEENNLLRKRLIPEDLIVLCSNNYLNLTQRQEVKKAAKEAIDLYGTGSGASQLVSGYTKLHREAELTLKGIKKMPSCITVGSGYLANIAVITSLTNKGDIILSDELNHASIIDGVRLSKAERFIYPHKNTKEVEKFLDKNRKRFRRCLIVTDGVFSMDGDLAPLVELSRIAEQFECFLVMDDAHATGTVGYSSLHFWGLRWKEHIVEVGTFSKALGSYGAYICGSEVFINYLINKARPVIFSTSLPPSAVATAKTSLEILEREPQLMERLRKLSEWLKKELKHLGFDLGITEDFTPIVPIMVYDEGKALKLRDKLLEKGFFVQAIRYPTVAKGKARLRLTVTLEHSKEVYEEFLRELSTMTI